MNKKTTHPVYPVALPDEQITQLKQSVAPIMALPETEMVTLVPDKTGFRFMGCPNCSEGTQEGQLTWSIDDPHHVTCRYCKMVFPNEIFPEDREMTFVNPVGVEVKYPYWENKTGYKYLFTAHGWREARVYFAGRAQDLGELYQLTKDRAYARRAGLILDAFARYYPGFLVSQDWPHRPKGFVLTPPYPSGGGKWGRWRHDEMPTDLVYAYDAIYNSGELERLSAETETDVKKRIEEDFFRGAIHQDQLHETDYSNAAPRIYHGYIAIGRVLGDPGLVHEGVRQSRGLFERQFYEDGFWLEGSVGYHQMTMAGMEQVFQALKGYSDPPDYTDPIDGTRFDHLDAEQDIAIVKRAKHISQICRYPDGRTLPIHDNWALFRNLHKPDVSQSTLLPGVGHAWLGLGTGVDQVQLHLHFSGGYGHEHADNLSMAFFAKGQELLPDIGYTHTRHRSWSTSSLSHNTVVIDEKNQYTRGHANPSDGRLLAFETQFEPVQWVEASGENGYPDLAKIYQRGLLLIQANKTDVYAVDVFRVIGGGQHDWALHGSADADGSVSVNVPLTPYGPNLLPGINVRFPSGEADPGDAQGRNSSYAYFQNVSHGDSSDHVTLTCHTDSSPVGVRTHVLNQQGTKLFVGNAMSFRRAEENDALLEQYRMPIMLLRKNGPAPLSSLFVAVHEPFDASPFIQQVVLNQIETGIVLSVVHHTVTDHIIYRTSSHPVASGDLHLEGDLGFVREQNGVPQMMGLWGGSRLTWKNHALNGNGIYEGLVLKTQRKDAGDGHDGLIISGELPAGHVLKGTTAIITFADGTTRGCRIASVEQTGGQMLVILENDPGFMITDHGAKHLFFPLREMVGAVHYKIRTSVFHQKTF